MERRFARFEDACRYECKMSYINNVRDRVEVYCVSTYNIERLPSYKAEEIEACRHISYFDVDEALKLSRKMFGEDTTGEFIDDCVLIEDLCNISSTAPVAYPVNKTEVSARPESNRNFVYAFKNITGSGYVVNYDATNTEVNDFLHKFDIYGKRGEYKISVDGNHQEVWFEVSNSVWHMLHSHVFRTAFKRMGTELVFDYPFET